MVYIFSSQPSFLVVFCIKLDLLNQRIKVETVQCSLLSPPPSHSQNCHMMKKPSIPHDALLLRVFYNERIIKLRFSFPQT